MPWRDPENWTAEIMAPAITVIIAWLRSHYDGSEPDWKRRVLEACLCGGVTFSLGFAIKAIGASGDWVYAVGGAVGLFGVDYVRAVGRKVIDRRADRL